MVPIRHREVPASRGPFRAASIMSEDRLSTWLGFAKFALGTFTLGLVTTLVNSSIQTREVELREQEQVGQFLQHALQEDVGVRRRFAQYFATVTRSTRLREGWARYSELVEREYEETLREKEELERLAAAENLEGLEREALNSRIAELEQALSPSPSTAFRAATPRIYIHIREEGQRPGARQVAEFLAGTWTVPGIERLDVGPASTELRYFRRQEQAEAEEIGRAIRSRGVPVEVRYVPGFETSSRVRLRTYELWFSPSPITPGPGG